MTPERAPRVLVVDDVDATRQRLVRILSTRGYEAVVARSGREAFDLLTTGPRVHAILLDLVMPEIDGWEFRHYQLRDPRLARIPTIVISIKALAEHDRYALRVGSADVINKPFEDHQILEALSRVGDARPSAAHDDRPWRTREGGVLFWSRRGVVACEAHAPTAGSPQWRDEGWCVIPAGAGRNRVEYGCQFCGGSAIRHRRR